MFRVGRWDVEGRVKSVVVEEEKEVLGPTDRGGREGGSRVSKKGW